MMADAGRQGREEALGVPLEDPSECREQELGTLPAPLFDDAHSDRVQWIRTTANDIRQDEIVTLVDLRHGRT